MAHVDAEYSQDTLVVDTRAYGDTLVVDTRAYGDTIVVGLTGDLDMAAAQPLHDALAYVQASAPRRLILDLRRVSFIDSTGLHLIVSVHEQCERGATTKLYLRPGPPAVHRTFQLTGLEGRLPFLGGATGAARSLS